MTPEQQDEAFKARVKLEAGQRANIQKATFAEVLRLLNLAAEDIKKRLDSQPKEFAAWYLPQLKKEIENTLLRFGEESGQAAIQGQGKAWQAGADLIDKPLEAAALPITAILPKLDTGQLLAMQTFLTGKMKDVAHDTINRVNDQLALTLIGSQDVSQAITNIQEVMGGISRRRAQTIVRTELGRAYSTASQLRIEQAAERLPMLRKQWRRSGKIHSRRKHDLTDGQVRPVDKPFVLGTGSVKDEDSTAGIRVMHPHDPAAPPAETINCGCISLPYIASWAEAGALVNPGKKPFSAAEIALNPTKEELANPGPNIGQLMDARDQAQGRASGAAEPVALEAPKARRVLREVEQRIAAEKVEVAVVIDRSGNILNEARGDADRVSVPSASLKDAIVTHTHVDIASFSESDIKAAMTHQMAEIRAIDPWYTYIMRPGPKGWDEALWANVVAPLYGQLEAETVGRLLDLMSADKMTRDNFAEHAQHSIWRRISREVGLRYTRRKRA